MAKFLGTDIAYKMSRSIGVPVGVAIKADDPAAGPFGTTIFGLVKLLLRKRG